jgi:hypothetical protein
MSGTLWASLVTALGLLIFFLNGHIGIWIFDVIWQIALPVLSLMGHALGDVSGAIIVAALLTGWLFWVCIFTLFSRWRSKS